MTAIEPIDPIIAGHNSFFGVDHLSQTRGAEKAEKFANVENIVGVLRLCDDIGVSAVMMSTHPRAAEVSRVLAAQSELVSRIRIYPLVPYIQKYVRGSNEKGLANLIFDTLGQAPLGQRLALMLKGGKGVMRNDLEQMLRLLLDVELLPFKNLKLGAVFLHDALTDLALGLGLEHILTIYRRHVEETYGVQAGLTTKNLPLLRDRLEAMGWTNPLVMASLNAAGFYVNPSLEQCAETVRRPGLDFVAMSTLASGHLHPDEAYRYLGQFPEIRSVVVGMSRREHLEETVQTLRQHLPWLDNRGREEPCPSEIRE